MRTQLIKSIKDVFISKSLKLDMTSNAPRVFNSRLFIYDDYSHNLPYQAKKYFFRPHSTNKAPFITLTDEAFETVCNNVFTANVGTTNSASIRIKYFTSEERVKEAQVEVQAVGSFGSHIVLWRGRLEDFTRYLRDHQEVTATHTTCRVEFTGRKAGAIGKIGKIRLEMSLPTYYYWKKDGIREYLYVLGYEHISDMGRETYIGWNEELNYCKEL